MQGAILAEAQMQAADLRGLQIQGAYLANAEMQGALLIGSAETPILLNSTGLKASHLPSALKLVDFSEANALKPKQLIHCFADASVILPKGIARPCHWHPEVLETAVNEPWPCSSNDPFVGHWRGWIEANGGTWPTSPLFEHFKDVTAIAPPPGCRLIKDIAKRL